MGDNLIETMKNLYLKQYIESGYEPLYSSCTKEELFVEMSDGVKLHTTIYKPDTAIEKLPVILTRTCYPILEPICQLHGEELSKRGYIYIYQYCRGTGPSEGQWVPNINERQDGIETVDWVLKQPWTDVLGVWGTSYLALTGWAMADAVNGKVTSMCLNHYGTDRFTSAYEKGMFRQDVLTSWSMQNTGFKVTSDYDETCKYMPQEEVDVNLWGAEVPWYREYVTNTRKEDSYWQQGFWKQLSEIPTKVQMPIYIVSGWYDHHLGSTLKSWSMLNPVSKKHSWFDIGAWNHSFINCIADKETVNSDSGEVYRMLNWFDITLKQRELPESRIRTYQINEDKWYEMKSWESKSVNPKKLWLNTKDKAIESEVVKEEADCQYIYDPKNPVTTYGSESCLQNMSFNGSLMQKEANYRPDVISFVSAPLEKDLEIMGKIELELFVKSDCEDTAFTAKVMQVNQAGVAYNIRSSIATIEQGSIDGENYVPNTVVKVVIEMWDVCYTIKKGEKLRLDISSSDYPNYHIHSNYRGVWGKQTKQKLANQTLLSGERYPSAITIQAK